MAAIDGARFGHVNVTGPDWRVLAAFYGDVFGCTIVPSERHYRSADLDGATQLRDAHMTGAHLACRVTATPARPSRSTSTRFGGRLRYAIVEIGPRTFSEADDAP